MLQAIFGPDVALGSSFIGSLHALTEGNPFFIEEMLMACWWLATSRAPMACGVRDPWSTYACRARDEAVGRRLEALSEAARRIAAIAAVAGRRSSSACCNR